MNIIKKKNIVMSIILSIIIILSMFVPYLSKNIHAEDVTSYRGWTKKIENFDEAIYVTPAGYELTEENSIVAYCFNFTYATPPYLDSGKDFPIYNKQVGNSNLFTDLATSERVSGEELYKKINNVLYNGYPHDMSDIKGDLSDARFRAVTQYAVWYFTDKDINERPETKLSSDEQTVFKKLTEQTEIKEAPADLTFNIYQNDMTVKASTDTGAQKPNYQHLISATVVKTTGEEVELEKTADIYAKKSWEKVTEAEEKPTVKLVLKNKLTKEKVEVANNPQEVTTDKNSSTSSEAKWTNLPGTVRDYIVEEEVVPAGYAYKQTTGTGKKDAPYTIVNEKKENFGVIQSIIVTKNWTNFPDNKNEEIYFSLYKKIGNDISLVEKTDLINGSNFVNPKQLSPTLFSTLTVPLWDKLYLKTREFPDKETETEKGRVVEYFVKEVTKDNKDWTKQNFITHQPLMEVKNTGAATYLYATFNNEYAPTKTPVTITAEKKWSGGNIQSSENIKFKLERKLEDEADDKFKYVEGSEVKVGTDNKHEWKNIPQSDETGKKYVYRVLESVGEKNYTASVETQDNKVFVVTNTFKEKEKLVKFKVKKINEFNEQLAGAVLKITTKEGVAVTNSWTSKADAVEEISLVPGEYKLIEEKTPDDSKFEKLKELPFKLETDGTIKYANPEKEEEWLTFENIEDKNTLYVNNKYKEKTITIEKKWENIDSLTEEEKESLEAELTVLLLHNSKNVGVENAIKLNLKNNVKEKRIPIEGLKVEISEKDEADNSQKINGQEVTIKGKKFALKVENNGDNYVVTNTLITESQEKDKKISINIEAEKELKNAQLKGNDFKFSLLKYKGKAENFANNINNEQEFEEVEQVTNDAQGKIKFSEQKIGEDELAYYLIKEIDDKQEGIKYDKTVHILFASKNGLQVYKQDPLQVLPFKENVPKFVNTKEIDKELEFNIQAKKEFENGQLVGDDFEFVLSRYNGEINDFNLDPTPQFVTDEKLFTEVATAKNNREGIVNFTVRVKDTEEVHFRITEKNTNKKGIEYDPNEYIVIIKNGEIQVLNLQEDNNTPKLYNDANQIKFINKKEDIKDDYKEIFISKQDLGGKEIANAKIQILDENGQEVKAGQVLTTDNQELILDGKKGSWLSKEGVSQQLKVKTGKYIFREVVAPAGYKKVTDIKFEVTEDGKVVVLEDNNKEVFTNKGKSKVATVENNNKLKVIDDILSLTFTKVEIKEGQEELLANAIFNLVKVDGGNIGTWNTTTNNKNTISLEAGKYILTEEKAPEGYKNLGTINLILKDDGSVEFEGNVTENARYNDGTITLINKKEAVKKEKITIKVNKEWIVPAGITSPENITVVLSPTNKQLVLNKANNWKGEFVDLDKTNAQGEEINYTVKELPVAGYTTEVKGDILNGYTIINKYNKVEEPKAEKIDIPVTKIWNGIEKQTAPEIKVKLVKNNVLTDKTLTLNQANNFTGKFTDLVVKDNEKAANNVYTVVEVGAVNNIISLLGKTYKVEITGNHNGFVITNMLNDKPKIDKPIKPNEPQKPKQEEPKLSEVKISKKDLNTALELEGALLKIVKGETAEGEEVANWVTTVQQRKINLAEGIYTLVEIEAPKGYEIAESITFKVAKDGKIEIKDSKGSWQTEEDGVVTMFDKPEIKEQPKNNTNKKEKAKLSKTGLDIYETFVTGIFTFILCLGLFATKRRVNK